MDAGAADTPNLPMLFSKIEPASAGCAAPRTTESRSAPTKAMECRGEWSRWKGLEKREGWRKREGRGREGKEAKTSQAKNENEKGQPSINKGKTEQGEGQSETAAAASECGQLGVGGHKPVEVSEDERAINENLRDQAVESPDEGSVLLDGGDTHCLRKARDKKEWESAQSITVISLRAQCSYAKMRSQASCYPNRRCSIIPVAKLTDAGYVLRWDRRGCQIVEFCR